MLLTVSIIALFASQAGSVVATTLSAPPFDCPLGFRNVVFNSGGFKQPGFPQPRWSTLVSHGVTSWVGFLNTTNLENPSNIPLNILAVNKPRILGNPEYVQQALHFLKSDNPPPYLELFNEPDYSWEGKSPITGPLAAAKALKPILDGHWPKTTLLSPALASSANETWWAMFNGPKGCDGCMDSTNKIGIVAAHFYDPDPNNVLDRMERVAKIWLGKHIWVTELAPATRNMQCSLNAQQMKEWMTSIVRGITTRATLKNVRRIYWNAGEWSPFHDGDDESVCNHSLTFTNGTATKLLEHYSSLCKV